MINHIFTACQYTYIVYITARRGEIVTVACMCWFAESEGWTQRKRQREDGACSLSGSRSTDMKRGPCVMPKDICVLEEQISDVSG